MMSETYKYLSELSAKGHKSLSTTRIVVLQAGVMLSMTEITTKPCLKWSARPRIRARNAHTMLLKG